jgi:D-alanine-D-alanine ligase
VKVTILTSLEEENSAELDPVVGQVARALRKNGHSVSVFGIYADVKKLYSGLKRRKPDLVFNLIEWFAEDLTADIGVCGFLDLLGIPYTGCGPGEFYLNQDKALAKKLLAYEGIPYPKFAVFPKDRSFETGGNLRMPLFVKPVRMDASIGIDRNSLVTDANQMMKRVLMIHEKCDDAALAEEYIDGREFQVGVLGNGDTAIALPPVEVDFSGMPEGAPHVLDSKAKWDEKSAEYKGTKTVLALDLPDELRARLARSALDAYRALRVRDYGRVDMRLAGTGEIYVLEVNASCYLEKGSEFATAAKAAGIEWEELIARIVGLAMGRYGKKRGI